MTLQETRPLLGVVSFSSLLSYISRVGATGKKVLLFSERKRDS